MPWWDARQARLQKASPKQVTTEEEQQLKSSGEATAETGATITMEEQYRTSEEEKRREAEWESRPARERWTIQLFAATVAALLTGQSVAASSFGAIVIDQIKQGRDTMPASEPQLTFFLVSNFIGMTVGCLVSGVIGQRIGPRNMMLVVSVPSLLCWIALALAPNIHIMTAVRFMHGIFNASAIAVNMRFIANTCCPRYRGLLSTIPELAAITSIVVPFVEGQLLSWRTCSLINGLSLFALIAGGLLLLPSDPEWLLARGRLEEARRSILFYRGPDADTSRIKEEAVSAAEPPPSTVQVISSLRQRRFFLPVVYVAVVMVANVWTGASVVQNYAVLFFRRVGVRTEPFLLTILVTSSRLPAVFFSSVLLDRCGRRPLLVISALGMAACHLGMVAFFLVPALGVHSAIPIACLTGANCFFQLGLSPINWVLLGELLPTHLSELCGSWLVSFYSMITMAQLQVLPTLLNTLGEPGVFALWAALLLVLVLFTILILPETSGLTSPEIEAVFQLEAPLRRVVSLATSVISLPADKISREPEFSKRSNAVV